MMKIVFFFIGMLPIVLAILVVVLVFVGNSKEKKYTASQVESGEDKRIFLNFAKSLFEQPDLYQYAAGSYIHTTHSGNTTTYHFYSYVVAFNEEGELYICPYQCENHVPYLRNKMKVDFSEAAISYKIKKDQTDFTIHIAGEPLPVWVEDVVKSDGTDDTQAPFAIDQREVRAKLNEMLPKFKELRNQQRG